MREGVSSVNFSYPLHNFLGLITLLKTFCFSAMKKISEENERATYLKDIGHFQVVNK